MFVTEISSDIEHPIEISAITEKEYKTITKIRYSFNWKAERSTGSVFKLRIMGQSDILGLMSVVNVDAEQRIEIKLLASSKENIGSHKQFDRIAGNMIAYAAIMALRKYGAEAAISLVPKTELYYHYINKYGFQPAGRSLFIAGTEILKLLKKYDYV